jgi:UDP-N-acetylglucosamine transferase subunit ALG13
VAGNSWQLDYITATFPGISTIELQGYNVHYSRSGSGFMWSIFSQLPRLLKTIRGEHQWLQQLTANRHFDGIISDNRYGLYHARIPSVIMTHQLQPQTGLGSFADNQLRKFHYRLLSRYGACWVVDVPGNPNLAGTLAHPSSLPANTNYIGLLSQLEATSAQEENLLVLLSGPEPQRTILAQLLWKQLQGYKGKVVFVEGSYDAATPASVPASITYHKRITKEALQPLIANSSMVICRSGYSTLMDLVILGKKAILIPTPGQTEQEYLGRHLHAEGVFYSKSQKGFDLHQALLGAKAFPFKKLPLEDAGQLYKPVISQWLASL